MLIKIFRFLLVFLLLVGLYFAYIFYGQYREHKRSTAYYENIVDTASSMLSVLRDSIEIGYQNAKRTLHIYVPPNYARDHYSFSSHLSN